MREILIACGVALGFGAGGCGAKEDATLAVEARSVTLAKATSPFGDKLTGSLEVVFDLGNYAGDPITVESIALSLSRGGAPIVSAAKFETPASTTFPFALSPGGRRAVSYTITREGLTAAEVTELCAGPVTISGSARQAGRGQLAIGATPTTVSGCP